MVLCDCVGSLVLIIITTIIVLASETGTGIRGLMRRMATLTQGNQELLVVRDIVGGDNWSYKSCKAPVK